MKRRPEPEMTSPTVEGHRPLGESPEKRAVARPSAEGSREVDPAGATVSWHDDGSGMMPGVPSAAGAGASGPLLRRVAQFVLLERLGAGGMGVVFAAFDEKLERKVAIKLVATSGGDSRAQERLLREAQAQGRLSHPNVVTVYEVGALSEGQLFIAMELVKGETLREWQRGEKRTWQEALAKYVAAGEGLAAAHRNGIVHRDFKPDNILLGEDGRVRVADFGLAFSAEAAQDPSSPGTSGSREAPSGGSRKLALTAVGAVAGTPGYMAPEQLAGAAMDARTDQFAFCVALYEALYDERPFSDFAFTREEPVTMRRSEPDPAHPRWLWSVIVRGLSADPAARFASMDELLAELTRNRDRTRRRLIAGGSVAGMVVMAGVTIAVLTSQRGPAPCPIADEEMAGVWDAAAKDGVRAALLGTGAAFAGSVWASTHATFERYSQRWLGAHQAACEATNVKKVQSAELLDRRMECLAGRKRTLAAAVEVLQLRPSQAMERVAEIVGSLAEIELCADRGALLELGSRRGAWARSSDPQEQAKLDSARTQLARARAFVTAGDLDSADAAIAQATKLNEELNEEAVQAEIRFTEGIVKLRRGEVAVSVSSLDRAAELAIASHHDELLADIWIFLARDVGAREQRPAQIETWLGQAEAWVQRLNHNRDPRRFSVEATRGNLQLTAGKAGESAKTLSLAISTGESLWGKEDQRLIASLRDRALAYGRLRQPKDAMADGERALALGIATWGAEHPDVARTRRTLGLLYVEQLGDVERGKKEIELALKLFASYLGPDSIEVANCEQALSQAGLYRGDYAAALEHAERADRIFLQRLGVDHPRRGEALLGVGVLRYMRKDYEGSLDAYQRSLPILRATFGESHASVAVLLSNIGETLLALGRADAARAEFERALEILEGKLGLEHADLALPLKGLGLAFLAGNRPGEALSVLERALALRLRSAAASDPQEMAEIRWALARTLRALGRTPQRAHELAQASLATYRTLGPESAARVDEISKWLPRGMAAKAAAPAPPAATP